MLATGAPNACLLAGRRTALRAERVARAVYMVVMMAVIEEETMIWNGWLLDIKATEVDGTAKTNEGAAFE